MRRIRFSRTQWARAVLAMTVLATVAPVSAFGQIESRIGTWELDLAKSTFSPGPAPRRQTLTYQAAGKQWTALVQGIDASGRPINPDVDNLLIRFDGRDHPTANADYETTTWQRLDPSKYLVIRKKAGKVVLTSANVLSPDGKTMTITTTGKNASGQPVNNVRVYVKK